MKKLSDLDLGDIYWKLEFDEEMKLLFDFVSETARRSLLMAVARATHRCVSFEDPYVPRWEAKRALQDHALGGALADRWQSQVAARVAVIFGEYERA